MRFRLIILAFSLAGLACGCRQQDGQWPAVVRALGSSSKTPAGPKPATKSDVPQSKKTSTEPSQDANRDSQPDLQPWPPETVAFEGTKAAQEWSANGLQLKFCWCPAGTFMMGSPKEEKDRSFNGYYEEQTMVRLTKGFWLAKYETTQEQWERMMGTNLIQQLDMASAQSRWETRNPDAETWWDRNELKWRPQRRASTPGAPNFGEGSGFPMYYVNHLEATDCT